MFTGVWIKDSRIQPVEAAYNEIASEYRRHKYVVESDVLSEEESADYAVVIVGKTEAALSCGNMFIKTYTILSDLHIIQRIETEFNSL